MVSPSLKGLRIHDFAIGRTHELVISNEAELLMTIESATQFCLDNGDVFAVFTHSWHMCQLMLTPSHDMMIESNMGWLSRHAGFHEDVPEWPEHMGNRLPAHWHSRARMVAGAMSRAFIDAAELEFPAELQIQIHPTNERLEREGFLPPEPRAPIEGAATIGFVFGEEQTMGWFAERLAPGLGLDPAVASIQDVHQEIQNRYESVIGPLNRLTGAPGHADHVVELTGDGWTPHRAC